MGTGRNFLLQIYLLYISTHQVLHIRHTIGMTHKTIIKPLKGEDKEGNQVQTD